MKSWVVTGATRGIGFGFVENLSSDSENQVFALIRSRGTAGPLEKLAAERKNIHVVLSDLSDPDKLTQAAADVSKATGGSVDVLLLNAGSAPTETGGLPPTAFHGKEAALENEISDNIKANLLCNVYVVNSFLNLVRNGHDKKIIFITSNSGDIEFTRITGLPAMIGYSVAKMGMNMIMTKFGIELAGEGIKTLSISPGWVDTDAAKTVTGDSEVRKWILNAFHKLDPGVEGPAPVDQSVADQLRVIQSLQQPDSGKVLTHHGTSNDWF